MAVAVLVLMGGAGVLVAGAIAFHWSRFRRCEKAILTAQRQGATSTDAGIAWGGLAFESYPRSDSSGLRLSAQRWGQKVDEIVRKGQQWPMTRVYGQGDMIFFVYFGVDDRIKDFACVSN